MYNGAGAGDRMERGSGKCIVLHHSERHLKNYVRIAGKPEHIPTVMDTMKWITVPDAAGIYRQVQLTRAAIVC